MKERERKKERKKERSIFLSRHSKLNSFIADRMSLARQPVIILPHSHSTYSLINEVGSL
jgi:hypothetical protein